MDWLRRGMNSTSFFQAKGGIAFHSTWGSGSPEAARTHTLGGAAQDDDTLSLTAGPSSTS
jgi:hypothetical protein